MDDFFKTIGNYVFGFFLWAFVILVAFPYFVLYAPIRDYFVEGATADQVLIIEGNLEITMGHIKPEWPLAKKRLKMPGHKYGLRNYYTVVGSLKEAEAWLKRKGYTKTEIYTQRMGPNQEGREKLFPVKRIPGSNAYSMITIALNRGTGDIEMLPFRYSREENPLDLSQLKYEQFKQVGGRYSYEFPPPTQWSTDGVGNVWGGHGMTYHYEEEIDGTVEQWAERHRRLPKVE